jgi:1-acyl-sn-glycerol-3-phosphate acyltransferase
MSELRDKSTTATASAAPVNLLEALRWRLLNIAQALFLAFWSGVCVTTALLVLCLTWNTRVSLWMARHTWAPPLLWASGAKLDVRGLEQLEGVRSCMIMSNHQSMLDIAVVYAALPKNLRFVAKRILLWVPFIGWYIWGMGMIAVDRNNRDQAIGALRRAIQLFDHKGGANIMTFPEGTRTRDGRVLPFKKGLFMLAIESGVPIVPMAIEGAHRVLPSDGFHVRPGTVHVNVGAPIETNGLTADDRDALIERVRSAVIDLNREVGGMGGDKAAFAARRS